MVQFRCKDVRIKRSFETVAKTQDELMKKTAEHARRAHNMKTGHHFFLFLPQWNGVMIHQSFSSAGV